MTTKNYFLLLTTIFFLHLSTNAQSYRIFFDRHHQPSGIKVSVNGITESFRPGDHLPDHIQLQDMHASPGLITGDKDGTPGPGRPLTNSLENLEPGLLPEADLVRDAAYTPDGGRIAVIYQQSGNIIFYDAETYDVLHIVEVGPGPTDLDLTMDRAFVACNQAREIYVIDLDDYSVSDVLPLDRRPSQVEASPDGSILYVAFPSYMDGSVAAYSAATHELLFECPELFIHHYGYNGHNGRKYYRYYRFILSDDGNFLTGTSDPGTVIIYNAKTGVEALRYEDRYFCGFNTSSTGDTLYLLTVTDDDMIIMYRLRSDDLSKIDSIQRPVADMYFGQDDLAVSGDGNRVLTQDTWNNNYLLFDFEMLNSTAYPANALFTQIINTTYDRKYAICQTENKIKLFDMDNPGFTGTYLQITGYFGAPSTTSYKFLAPVSHFSYENITSRDEKFYIIDFQDPVNILPDTMIIAGELPEADLTHRACLSGDGKKFVSANFLSANVSLIDRNTQALENMLDIDNVWIVTPIPGSEDVLLSGQSAASTYLFDTKSATIEKTIYVSQAWSVTVSQDGKFAYMIDVTGMLFKVALEGENTHIEGYVDVDFYQNRLLIIDLVNPLEYLPMTKPGLSPDGKWLLASAQDNNLGPVMQIVNTETMKIEKSLPIGNRATYDMAFTGDSRRACVAHATGFATIIYIDGADSYVENQVSSTSGNSFLAVAFNETTGKFLLGSKGMLNEVVPETGQITASHPYQNEYLLQIAADHNGLPMIRGQRKFFHNQETYDLPGVSEWFAYDTDHHLVVIPIPGPDKICVFDPMLTSMTELPAAGSQALTIFPNPAFNFVTVTAPGVMKKMEVYDFSGRLICREIPDKIRVTMELNNFVPGIYVIRAILEGSTSTGKFIVAH